MEERLNYLRNKYPNYRLNHGRPETSKVREMKRTDLGVKRYKDNIVDSSELLKLIKSYSIKFPQFKEIKLSFYNDGNYDVEITITGWMPELDADYKLRMALEAEQLELYELMTEEKRLQDIEKEKEQLEFLKSKYEKAKGGSDDMVYQRHALSSQEYSRAREEYMGIRPQEL